MPWTLKPPLSFSLSYPSQATYLLIQVHTHTCMYTRTSEALLPSSQASVPFPNLFPPYPPSRPTLLP